MSRSRKTRKPAVQTPAVERRTYPLHRGMFADRSVRIGEWVTDHHFMVRAECLLDPAGILSSDAAIKAKYGKRCEIDRVNLPDFDRVLGSDWSEGAHRPFTLSPVSLGWGSSEFERVMLLAEDGTRAFIGRHYAEAFHLQPGQVLYGTDPDGTLFDSPIREAVAFVIAPMRSGVTDADFGIIHPPAPRTTSEPTPEPQPEAIEPEPTPEPEPPPVVPFPPQQPEALPVNRHSTPDAVQGWAESADFGLPKVVTRKGENVWIKFSRKPRYAARRTLGAAGFRWAESKGAWYWKPAESVAA